MLRRAELIGHRVDYFLSRARICRRFASRASVFGFVPGDFSGQLHTIHKFQESGILMKFRKRGFVS
jgi:hypothetical protein